MLSCFFKKESQRSCAIPLRVKAPAIVVILMAICSSLDFSLFWYQQKQAVNQEKQDALRTTLKQVEFQMSLISTFAAAQSDLVSLLPSIQNAFQRQDREWIKTELAAFFKRQKESYNLELFQMHTPPATSFFRAHKPETFGDDLSQARMMVVATNKFKTTQKGLEMGRAGLAIRGVSPIFSQANHQGSLEFGYNLKPIIDNVKNTLGIHLGIYIDEKLGAAVKEFDQNKNYSDYVGGYIYLDSTDKNIIQKVAASSTFQDTLEPQFGSIAIEKIEYGKVMAPLIDYSGAKIGFIFIIKKFDQLDANFSKNIIWKCISLLLQLIVLAGVAITVYNGTLVSPLIHLTRKCVLLHEKDDSALNEFKERKDEIGILANTISNLSLTKKNNKPKP